MSVLPLLSESEKYQFDHPPLLAAEDKSLYFSVSKETEGKISQLRTPTNKVGFLLQYGYFKASSRFFVVSRFKEEDIEYVGKILKIPLENIDLNQYKKKIPSDHQAAILGLLDYKPFDKNTLEWLEKEAQNRVTHFAEPRQIFFELLELISNQRIEIPPYSRLSGIITKHYLSYEDKLIKIVRENLSEDCCAKLEALLKISEEKGQGVLNQLKVINQSTRPRSVQESIKVFCKLEEYFKDLLPVIKILNLSHSTCSYYSTWIKKAKFSQIKQFHDKHKKYLYLIAFIQNQFYLRQDGFIEILIKSVQSLKNSANKNLRDLEQLTREERRTAAYNLTKSHQNYKELVDEIKGITELPLLSDTHKLKNIVDLLNTHYDQKNEAAQQKMKLFEESLNYMAKNKDYFEILEKLSLKLQHRVAGILKVLIFNEDTSQKTILHAIAYFKEKNGDIDHRAPIGFLKKEEKEALGNGKTNFRKSLYKVFLFMHVASAIRAGELNLKYSYEYLSIQDYLINNKAWEEQKEELLKMTNLESFANCSEVLDLLKTQLRDQYCITNQRFLEGKNPYLSFNKKGKLQIETPPLEDKDTKYIAGVLEQVGYLPILRILSDVNGVSQFTQSLKHHSIKYVKSRPSAEVFFAGIIGLGCNIGIPKMAKISTGIKENTLLGTVNWYFSHKGLLEANQHLVEFISNLSLPNVFIREKDQLHGSSDGQKFNVGVDSLLANYSFKYCGKYKGVSVYTFIDERQALFHLLVLSASEREAPYVIDGLLSSSLVKINLHSTDTHGYSETIFAATHFIDVAFAPRIKNVAKQHIYSFVPKKSYEKEGYKILPSRTINQKLIPKNWTEILRFMVTLKLKEVTASQLLKRLSSYAKDNPLYKALKEFGRIIKSIFILTYYDDVDLRQRIEKQLNRIEHSNKFSNAVFYANNSEFKQPSREEQEIATACKVIIQNSIVLWNYLYLSQMLVDCEDYKERTKVINLIKNGSVMTWRHINLHGEFNFKKLAANKNWFNMDKILSLELTQEVL